MFFKKASIVALGGMVSLCCVTTPAHAWGDEGHEIVALIAKHYLDPRRRDPGQQYSGRGLDASDAQREYRRRGHLG